MHHYKYSLTELENLISWEKEVYLSLLIAELEKERQRLEEQIRKM